MRRRGPQRERRCKKPRITNVLFLCKKEGQGPRLPSQTPQHEMNVPHSPEYSSAEIRSKMSTANVANLKQTGFGYEHLRAY